MDHLEYPTAAQWEDRRNWFEAAEETARGDGSYLVSEQACALTADVQACFCAGAWGAVTILALTVIDAALRETEVPGFTGNTKKLLEMAGMRSDYQQLRRRRNALIHLDPDAPTLTVDDQWCSRDELERDARHAVELMFEAFYASPMV